jgi:hypothetical protein
MRLRLERQQRQDQVSGGEDGGHDDGPGADESGEAPAGPIAQDARMPPV